MTQQESWQSMKTFNMETNYKKDDKEYTAQLNFSIRGGFPRITLFKDKEDVTRDTILIAKFNYKRIDRLFTYLLAFKDIKHQGDIFRFKTNGVIYDKDGNPTKEIVEECIIELSKVSNIFRISLYTKDTKEQDKIYFEFNDTHDLFYDIEEDVYVTTDEQDLPYITYISQIEYLRDTFRLLHSTYIKETQTKLLPNKVQAIG